MRSDLNKQLCERERAGHTKSYKRGRRAKKYNPDMGDEGENYRQHESMTFRHKDDPKSFNENLTPLLGQVRKAVGKRWDDFYSEFCKVFDMRSVINQHILQHLEEFCERDIYIGKDGELYVNRQYSPTVKLKDSTFVEYYVDPRDGIIKRNNHYKTHKQRSREHAAEMTRERAKVYVEIDKDNVLHCIEGVWFHFTLKDIPPGKMEYTKPLSADLFNLKYTNKTKTWEQLSEVERKHFGHKHFVGKSVCDLFTGDVMYNDGTKFTKKRYHATKKTASHKMLKNAGIV